MSTLEGIPVGTIRSNLNNAKVSPEKWCQVFGHKFVLDAFAGENYCKECFKTENEINGEKENRN